MVSHSYRKAGTTAAATAKSSFSVCAPLQSFICNPWESEETTKGSALNWMTKVSPGQMLMLVGGTKGAPGNWGLIQAPAKNGNPHNQAAFWSDEFPSSCPAVDIGSISQQVDTGNNGPFAAPGMNVRFDNPVNQLTSNASPIVIDGFKPNTNSSNAGSCANSVDARPVGFKQVNEDNGAAYDSLCGASAPTGSCPLPRDRTMTNLGGNAWSTSLKGTGADPQDLLAYWKNHHTGSSIPMFYDANQKKYVDVSTRWQIYQMENDTTNYPSAAFTAASDSREPSAPFCSASKPAKDLSRRKINVAVVDCDYWSINGASNNLPVFTLMAEFFITEPATSGGSIYGELIKTYQVNGQGSNLYHLVQLVK